MKHIVFWTSQKKNVDNASQWNSPLKRTKNFVHVGGCAVTALHEICVVSLGSTACIRVERPPFGNDKMFTVS